MSARQIAALMLLTGALASGAQARDPGPALEACRAHGEQELRKDAPGAPALVLSRDRHLFLQPREDKLGTQPLDAVLTGHGAVVYESTPSVEFSFVCLLAERNRPLFFYWLPRGSDASALAQCTRSGDLRANPSECLESLLKLHEADMLHITTERFHEARQRDEAARSNSATRQHTEAGQRWHAYRNAECARQREMAPGKDADAVHAACMVELTRQRGAVLRER